MTAKDSYGTDRRRELDLSPQVERYFRKVHPSLLQKLRRAARGESTPESRAFVKSYRALAAKLRPSSGKSDSKLAVLTAVRLVEVVEYANKLLKRLERIKRTSSRTTRHDVRLELCMAHDSELWLLRRRVSALWRDIPRLIERLGGNPSEDLLHHRRPRPRLAERDQGLS